MDTFGNRLVKARKDKNYSQKALAEVLEITPTRLNYWEKDKREPDVEMIRKIAKALNVDPNYLIGINFWTKDMYEDYENAKSDEERLYLLEHNGVPADLQREYHVLLGKKKEPATKNDDGLDEREALFSSLSPDAQKQALDFLRFLAQQENAKVEE